MGEARKSLMFRLGQFFGHVARGATGPVSGPASGSGPRRVVNQEVQERTVRREDAVLTLRRTTIDEVEVRPASAERGDQGAGGSGVDNQEKQA